MSLTKASYSMISGAVANILDYGADPTGVADSTAAITAAIAASNCVYIPQGTFKITSLAINKTNFYMYGCGDSSVLQTTVAANIALTIGNTSSTENVTLRQFKIQGNSTNLGGIQLGTASNYVAWVLLDELTIRDIRNSGANGYGVRLRSVQELEVRNCRFLNNYFNVYRSNEGFVTATLFCGKKSYNGLGGVGFYFNGDVADLTIRDYIIEGNSAEGISADFYLDNLTISDCYFEENCASGSGNGHIYVTGNTATAYQYAKVNIERCAFHIMTAGSFPNVKLDATIALLTGNFNLLDLGSVTTTALTSATFVQNKNSGATNPIALYRALLGKIAAIDADENLQQFVLAKNMAYVTQTPSSGTPNNATYVNTSDGKLYFRDSAGVDHALY